MRDGKHVVLCIDDDEDFLDSMRMILEGSDFVMESASSAEEGLRRYREHRPDVVLVDLMMEEVDAGASFVTDVRAEGEPPPIFMLSSVGDSLSLSVDYSALGLAGVLQKPIDPNVLIRTLRAKLR